MVLGDQGSIPGRVIPKTQKMVLDAALLSTQHYKVRIKGKVEQSREWSSTPLHLGVVAIEKGAFESPSTKVTNLWLYISSIPSYVPYGPVDCRIHLLYLCRGIRNECPEYDIKQSNGEAYAEYPFIAITPMSTLTWSGSTWQDPMYGSNRTVWHLNWVQTNDLCLISDTYQCLGLFNFVDLCLQIPRHIYIYIYIYIYKPDLSLDNLQ